MILRNTNLVVENLYYLLWLKDSGLKDASFSVKIPDTIIVQSGKIMNWFFSSKNGEGLLMKKESNLKNTKIYESFTRDESKSGIVAYFIEQVGGESKAGKILKSKSEEEEEKELGIGLDIPKNEGHISVRYMTDEKLKQFLFTNQSEGRSGILQKFINPYGENQAIIQAIWSPQLCVFSKRMNYRYLFDPRYDPYERATTFDGAEMYSRTVPLRGKVISQEMRKFCENIVHRISHVSFQKIIIQRMVVYFKPDNNNSLNFLYCSSMRLQGEHIQPAVLEKLHHKIQNTPLIIETNYTRPAEIKLNYTTNTMRPISLENDIQCFHCQEKVQTKDLVPVSYEYIINNFEQNPIAQHSKISNVPVQEVPIENTFVPYKSLDHFVKDRTSEIPELITKIYHKLNVESYLKFKNNIKFINQKIKLCQQCYLDFSHYVKLSGAPTKEMKDFRFVKKANQKRGTLFTKEMKKIVTMKNMEMTEQKGHHLVKGLDKSVFLRMLNHLNEETNFIDTNKNQATSSIKSLVCHDGPLQIDVNQTKNTCTPKLSRPVSCNFFNSEAKLMAIHKEIDQFDRKINLVRKRDAQQQMTHMMEQVGNAYEKTKDQIEQQTISSYIRKLENTPHLDQQNMQLSLSKKHDYTEENMSMSSQKYNTQDCLDRKDELGEQEDLVEYEKEDSQNDMLYKQKQQLTQAKKTQHLQNPISLKFGGVRPYSNASSSMIRNIFKSYSRPSSSFQFPLDHDQSFPLKESYYINQHASLLAEQCGNSSTQMNSQTCSNMNGNSLSLLNNQNMSSIHPKSLRVKTASLLKRSSIGQNTSVANINRSDTINYTTKNNKSNINAINSLTNKQKPRPRPQSHQIDVNQFREDNIQDLQGSRYKQVSNKAFFGQKNHSHIDDTPQVDPIKIDLSHQMNDLQIFQLNLDEVQIDYINQRE